MNSLQSTMLPQTMACANKKYAPQKPNISHMPKLLNVHQCRKYASIYATYELTALNHKTRSLAAQTGVHCLLFMMKRWTPEMEADLAATKGC